MQHTGCPHSSTSTSWIYANLNKGDEFAPTQRGHVCMHRQSKIYASLGHGSVLKCSDMRARVQQSDAIANLNIPLFETIFDILKNDSAQYVLAMLCLGFNIPCHTIVNMHTEWHLHIWSTNVLHQYYSM